MKRRKPAPSAHPELALGKPTRTARRKATRIERERATLARGELFHDVIERAKGRCDLCRVPVPPGEIHHLLSGSQRRRCESLSSLVLCCPTCHAAYHRNDIDVLFWASSWANAHGFTETRAAIQKRIENVYAAKWAQLRTA